MFFKGSRYGKVDNYLFKRLDGSKVLLKKKREIPELKSILIHTVQEGERSDLISYRYLKDPLKFWKIADINQEINPEHLFQEPGKKIIIPSNDPDK